MKIQKVSDTQTTIKEYVVKLNRKTYTYRDYYNEKGKVIDSELTNSKNELVTDYDLIEKIQEMIDESEK